MNYLIRFILIEDLNAYPKTCKSAYLKIFRKILQNKNY